jgi:hypothetical protein
LKLETTKLEKAAVKAKAEEESNLTHLILRTLSRPKNRNIGEKCWFP